MIFSDSGPILNISYTPTLPLYPVPLHILQPFTREICQLSSNTGGDMCGGNSASTDLICFNSCSDGFSLNEHSLHTFLTNLWAIKRRVAAAMIIGLNFISINLKMALGASFVCSVEKTRWPVKAACKAISAVSMSRISPTKITFGSWRRMERRAEAKVYPTSGLTWL